MKKNLIKILTFLTIVWLSWTLIKYTSQTFAQSGTIDLTSIINTWCIEFTTPDWTVQKCDDVVIHYADEVYPVKKRQKTWGMNNFTDEEITVSIWEYILYKVDFVNLWDENIVGTVKDYLPNCITFITGSVHGDWISNAVFEHNSNNTQVRFRWISLHPGRSWYMLVTGQVSNSQNCQNVTEYTNTWSFKSTNPSGSELFDSVVAIRGDEWNPKLKIEKELLTTWILWAWDTVAYKITARNTWSWTARNVVIYDELPIPIEYVSSSITIPDYSFGTGTTWSTTYIEYSGFDLNQNWIVIVYLTWRIKDSFVFGDNLKNCATISSSNTTGDISCVEPNPNLSIVKELLTTWDLSSWDTVAYKITARNTWLSTALDIRIYDELPIQMAYQTSSIVGINNYRFGTGTTWWTIYIEYSGFDLIPNWTVIIYLTWKVKNWYSFDEENCVTIYSSNEAMDESCVRPNPYTPPASGDIIIIKTVNKSYVQHWDTIIYTIKYYNKSNTTLKNYTITDLWPAELTFRQASPHEDSRSWNMIIRDTLNPLPAHQTGTITITADVQ